MTKRVIENMLGASLSATPTTKAVTSLIVNLQSEDAEVRTQAWQAAGKAGAAAITPLVEVFGHEDPEVRRAATRAMWRIVRHAGRPGADKERGAVAGNLVALLGMDHPTWVKREAIWMLSEIGDAYAVGTLSGYLTDKHLRDDARMALERIPGSESLAALDNALGSAPKEFQPAIAVSLRKQGVSVKGHPSVARIPSRETEVKPI